MNKETIEKLQLIKKQLEEIIKQESNHNQPKEVVQEITRKKEGVNGGENMGKSQESPNEPSKKFKPTGEQIERWKNISPTNKTKGLLKVKGFSNEDMKNIKTQYEAHIILENLKGENI